MNHLVVSGINFHSTPIAIRERFTIPASCLKHALRGLSSLPHIKEAVVLSTCNRTEVYAVVSDVQAGLHEIDSFFTSTQAIADHEVLRPNFKLLREDVALHLFRVASGINSMVLGEGQIMSQVKAAYQAALDAGTASTVLDQLFKMALNCGKRVRSETSMSRRAVSVSSAAIELARDVIGSLKDKTVMVLGAGKMAQISVKHLLSEKGKGPVVLINRTAERIDNFLSNELPNRHRLKTGLSFDDRYSLATASDLLIVSTSAPEYLIELPELLARRSPNKELCIIDISVPRNVDPALKDVPGIKLFNADDLCDIVNRNLTERESLVGEAETIIMEALDNFHAWQRSLLVVPTIADLREKIEAIRLEHLAKSHNLCASSASADGRQHLEEISRAIVNQILHHPTVQLKATRDYEILRQQAEALRTLFSLDPLAEPLSSKNGGRRRTAESCQSKAKESYA